jgi:hypothetical protein
VAQKVQISLVDDLDGSPADETVVFALDGTTYEIDLSAVNANRLRGAFANSVGHARKAGRSSSGRRSAGRSGRHQRTGDIRAWARSQGITVSDRGRVSADVAAKYDAAHA